VVPFVTEEDVDMPRCSAKGSSSRGAASSDYKASCPVIGKEATAAAGDAAGARGAGGAKGSAGGVPEDEALMTPRERKEKQDLEARWLARPLYANEWEG